VYGVALSSSAKVTVSVKGSAAASYTVDAVVTAAPDGGTGSHWKATLRPTAASHDEYTIEAAASDGETITLERVVYGDVFFCSGQVANNQPRAVPRSLENQPASGH
jgi:hypothetical protein